MKRLQRLILLCLMLVIAGCSAKKTNPSERTAAIEDKTTAMQPVKDTMKETDRVKEETTEDIRIEDKTTEDTTTEDTTTEDTTTKEDVHDVVFSSESISDAIFERIDGISFGENCIVDRKELRYLTITYYGFDKKAHRGELICHKDLAEDFLDIFKELYHNKYPIEKMVLVDEYDGDDEKSMEADNTSCFNFREVPGSDHLSQHAYGRAIDINPLYNPYVTEDGYSPTNAGNYVDRDQDIPYKISHNDLCYQLFMEHGFTWGGDWNSMKDYQHFQKKEGE